jgi:hypothetical protein
MGELLGEQRNVNMHNCAAARIRAHGQRTAGPRRSVAHRLQADA